MFCKQNQGHRSRFTARSTFIPQEKEEVKYLDEDDYYEPEPAPVPVPPPSAKKKNKYLPGQKLLRKLHRERVKQDIEDMIGKLSIQ